MAKNKIQFQKGMSFDDFMQQYGTENKCRDQPFKLRWPNGFECLFCGNKTYREINHRNVFQCNRCHHQTSVTAGTIFHSTHLPLRKWFLSMFLITQSKNGISVLELCRQIGVSYNAAWKVKIANEPGLSFDAARTYFVKSDGAGDHPKYWPLPEEIAA